MKTEHFILLITAFQPIFCLRAITSFLINEKNSQLFHSVTNYLYADSYITLQVICDSNTPGLQIYPLWILKDVQCMQDMYDNEEVTQQKVLATISGEGLTDAPEFSREAYDAVMTSHPHVEYKQVTFQESTQQTFTCGQQHILSLQDESNAPYYQAQVPEDGSLPSHFWHRTRHAHNFTDQPSHVVTRTWAPGMYHFLFAIGMAPNQNASFTAKVRVVLRGQHGYLSAINWPLLPYSVVMSVLYLVLGTVWVFLWVRTSLHTEKIHIIIGAVAVAGAMTNTMMFVDMATTNSSGTGVFGLSWLSRVSAGVQSCLTSALLMVVSTGYGITRPVLHRSLVTGMVVLTCVAVTSRIAVIVVQDEDLKLKYEYPAVDMVVSGFYALTILVIGAFIMVSAIMTFNHLRTRKHTQNVVLFCLFMVTCIIGFVAEVVMVAVAYGWFSSCRQSWQSEWIFANFGSVETLVLLSVLMWLWRPIDRAQSYAFYPLAGEEGGVEADSEDELESTQLTPAAQSNKLHSGMMLLSTL